MRLFVAGFDPNYLSVIGCSRKYTYVMVRCVHIMFRISYLLSGSIPVIPAAVQAEHRGSADFVDWCLHRGRIRR